jgi:mannose-1-phosphate guanylyltransferase/phosphomannomutase
MLTINNRPLLSYILANCAAHGFKEIAINLHFRPEVIKNYFGDGSRFGLSIQYFIEDQLLGTAGSVKNMAHSIDNSGSFLVHYGDILTDQNLSLLNTFNSARTNSLATLLVHSRTKSNSIVLIDQNYCIQDFIERPTEEERLRFTSTWVNSGIAILNKSIIDHIPDGPADLPKNVYCKLTGSQRLFALPLSGYRCAIDSPDRYQKANEAIVSGECQTIPL